MAAEAVPAPAPTQLACPQGTFELWRQPSRNREALQAWCAADQLLLSAAADIAAESTLVVNDDHGALSVPLAAHTLWTDSYLSAQAVNENALRNHRPTPQVLWSVDEPAGNWPLVVLRVPKHMAMLEYQLSRVAHCLPEDGLLLCAGMDKHLPRQTAQVMERYFGSVERHPGRRKARLFSARQPLRTPLTTDFCSHYFCEPVQHELYNLPNVFSAEQLDIGARFLLEHLHKLPASEQAADLACGNGVLGIAALQRNKAASMLFADESAMAIRSAEHNTRQVLGRASEARFHHGDGLLNYERCFDLILCNPPFHLGHAVDEFVGRRLVAQGARALRPGGCMLLVTNRHLDYRGTLRTQFERAQQLGQNRKFRLWQAWRGC